MFTHQATIVPSTSQSMWTASTWLVENDTARNYVFFQTSLTLYPTFRVSGNTLNSEFHTIAILTVNARVNAFKMFRTHLLNNCPVSFYPRMFHLPFVPLTTNHYTQLFFYRQISRQIFNMYLHCTYLFHIVFFFFRPLHYIHKINGHGVFPHDSPGEQVDGFR
jgi:hypothetical protein